MVAAVAAGVVPEIEEDPGSPEALLVEIQSGSTVLLLCSRKI